MVSVDLQAPADGENRLSWRDAQHNWKLCGWCGRSWPCPPRRLAEHAAEASRRPWREAWTARHDLNGLRALPGWRADLGDAGRRIPRNRGPFD